MLTITIDPISPFYLAAYQTDNLGNYIEGKDESFTSDPFNVLNGSNTGVTTAPSTSLQSPVKPTDITAAISSLDGSSNIAATVLSSAAAAAYADADTEASSARNVGLGVGLGLGLPLVVAFSVGLTLLLCIRHRHSQPFRVIQSKSGNDNGTSIPYQAGERLEPVEMMGGNDGGNVRNKEAWRSCLGFTVTCTGSTVLSKRIIHHLLVHRDTSNSSYSCSRPLLVTIRS